MLDPNMIRQVALYGVIGSEVALSVGLGSLGGYYLDKSLGWDPWLTVLGTLLGCAAAGFFLWQLVQKLNKEQN